MDENTALTGIEQGHNAFTSASKSKMFSPRETAAIGRGAKQSRHIAAEKAKGNDIGSLYGISPKSDELIIKNKLREKAMRVNANSGAGYKDQAGTDKTNAIRGK